MRSLIFSFLLALLFALPVAAGTLVVANKADATVWLVEPESGDVHAKFDVGVGPHEVAASPDGRFAAVANYGDGGREGSTLTIIDVPEARIFRAVDLGEYTRPHGLSWLDRTRLLVTSETAQSLLVVDVWTGEVSAALATDARVSHMVAPHPLHHRAYVANLADGTMTTLEVDCGSHRVSTETGAGAEGIAVRPDGREAWVTNRAANTVTVVNLDTMAVAAVLPAGEFPIRVAFTPDGTSAFVPNARGGDVWVYDVATREVVTTVAVDSGTGGENAVPIGVLVDPSGSEAFVALTGQGQVAVLNTRTFRIERMLQAGGQPDGMAWCTAEPAPTPGEGGAYLDLVSFEDEPGRSRPGS